MINFKKISKSKLSRYVDVAYRDDEDLLKKYHTKIHTTVESAVSSTMLMIHDMSQNERLSYYEVIYNKNPIGYVVAFDNFLYSFGINVKFRKKEILIKWWEGIKNIIGNQFMSMLYDNNIRAINFLVRCGMKIKEYNEEHHSVILINE